MNRTEFYNAIAKALERVQPPTPWRVHTHRIIGHAVRVHLKRPWLATDEPSKVGKVRNLEIEVILSLRAYVFSSNMGETFARNSIANHLRSQYRTLCESADAVRENAA